MMKGFFTGKQTESASRPDGKAYSCVSCGLYTKVRNPRMKPYGNFKKQIMVIGEAPGEEEDRTGKPWQGTVGRLLQRKCKELGIDLFEDCVSINAVHCRPTDEHGANRGPTNYEISCCRRRTLQIVDEYMPKVIILAGNSAVYSLLGHRWKRDLGGITKWRGWCIPDQDLKAWVCPVFHPSYVERLSEGFGDNKTSEAMVIWTRDLERAFGMVDVSFPKYKTPEIEIIEDLRVFDKMKWGWIAFDYETTGLKPYASGHRIVAASIAYDEDYCYSFPFPPTRQKRQPFVRLLEDRNVGKIAHNMKFEDTWTAVKLKTNVVGWDWDTMLATHVLDNRPGITSLKFQVYVNFGVIDYDSEISEYLQGKTSDGNSVNRIDELLSLPHGIDKLLRYCGLDSVYAYRLAVKQVDKMNYKFLPF